MPTSVACSAYYLSHQVYRPSRLPNYVPEIGLTFELLFASTLRSNPITTPPINYYKKHSFPSVEPSIARSIYFLIWQSISRWLPLMLQEEVLTTLYMTRKIHAHPMLPEKDAFTHSKKPCRASLPSKEVDPLSFSYMCFARQTICRLCSVRRISVWPYQLCWFPLPLEV